MKITIAFAAKQADFGRAITYAHFKPKSDLLHDSLALLAAAIIGGVVFKAIVNIVDTAKSQAKIG